LSITLLPLDGSVRVRKPILFSSRRRLRLDVREELSLLEDLMDNFDSSSPTAADPDKVHRAALLSGHDRFPRYFGYDKHWWATLCRNGMMQKDGSLPPGLLDHLGIRDAVLAWINDEALWLTQRSAARRRDRKQRRMHYHAFRQPANAAPKNR
jgi:hypothetical protein